MAETEIRRECGSCTLCCKLVAVQSLGKAAGQRCDHQRATGCRIYEKRPRECMIWSCAWLVNNVNHAPVPLSRPDRSHYVVDCMPDYITARDEETGATQHITVLQVWCDPDYPDAHRDPALRAWLDRFAAQGIAALVRLSSNVAFPLIGPSMPGNSTGGWIETAPRMSVEPQHDRDEIMAMTKLTVETR